WPTVSPRGDLLAYALCAADFSCDVYTRALGKDFSVSATQTRLSRLNSTVFGIAWSRDGRSIIYGSGVDTGRIYLWRVPTSGGEPERLQLAGDHAGYPTVSLTSDRLAYTRFNSNSDIWKFDASGSQQTFLSSTLDERNPQFSPDGKRIV